MQQTAIIFDVDGTLVKSEHLDAKYFIQALRDVAGDIAISDDWSCYTKVTDVGIMTEILELNGYSNVNKLVADIRTRFGQLLRAYFDNGGSCLPIKGINAFLRHLASDGACATGIATGGWGHTASMKLAIAGIDVLGIPMSTSDDGDERTEIMLHCLKRMGGSYGRIVYIGDGVWDRDACAQLGWHFIGIGRKMHGKCKCWFEDYRDIGRVIEAIGER